MGTPRGAGALPPDRQEAMQQAEDWAEDEAAQETGPLPSPRPPEDGR